MKLSTKTYLGTLVLAALVAACGAAGLTGIGGLTETLAFVTGPAWDAADGAMEATIGLRGQMLAVDTMVAGGDAKEMMAAETAGALESLARMRGSGQFDAAALRTLDAGLGAYDKARLQVIADHGTYAEADDAFRAQLAQFQELLTHAEELGDQQVEALEAQPSLQTSWEGGLAARWTAADGCMESQIRMLERLYHYERFRLALTRQARDEEARSFATALVGLEERLGEVVQLTVFKAATVPEGAFAGQPYPVALQQALREHRTRGEAAITRREAFVSAHAAYAQATAALSETIEALEAQADTVVETKVQASQAWAERVIWIALMASLALVIVVAALAVRSLRPLNELENVAGRVARGELRHEVTVSGDDEVGRVAGAFREMVDQLRAYTGQSNQISQALAAATVEINASVQEQSQVLTTQATAIAEASTSLEELKANAVRNDERARQVLGTAKGTINGMQSVQDQVEQIATSIVALSEKIQQIGEILDTVSDIADQSNLLALNASIEASKAGEYGRGFEVVAAEVRSLAQQSQKATLNIRTMLRDIQRAMTASVMQTEEGTKRVAKQATELNVATQSVEQIVYATREQTQAIEQVVEAVTSVSESIGQSQASTGQIAESTTMLVQQSDDLKATLGRFTL